MQESNQQSNSTEEKLRRGIRKLYGVKTSHYVKFEPRLEQLIEAVNSLYLPREQVEAAIGEDEEPGRIFGPGMPSFQRDQLRREIRSKLALNTKDKPNIEGET